jgi:hypothetical protein
MSAGERKRELQRAWWARNRAAENAKRYAKRKQKRELFREYKSKLSCAHCGESDPKCIDFHHVDASKKRKGISAMSTAGGWSDETLRREVEKCISLCANCHRKVHAEQRRREADAQQG